MQRFKVEWRLITWWPEISWLLLFPLTNASGKRLQLRQPFTHGRTILVPTFSIPILLGERIIKYHCTMALARFYTQLFAPKPQYTSVPFPFPFDFHFHSVFFLSFTNQDFGFRGWGSNCSCSCCLIAASLLSPMAFLARQWQILLCWFSPQLLHVLLNIKLEILYY